MVEHETASDLRSLLPSVTALQDYASYVEREDVLSEYWFIRDFSGGKHHKPVYAWCGGQPALLRVLSGERVVPFVPWERVQSATWEELRGASEMGEYMGMVGASRVVSRALALGEAHLVALDAIRLNAEDAAVGYREGDWLLCLASNSLGNEKREQADAPAVLGASAFSRQGEVEVPLDWMTKDVLLHYVCDESGSRRALVVGLPLGEEGLAQLDYCEGEGPFVYTIAATVEEPRAMAQLELFARQYRVWHTEQVDPFRGKSFIAYKPVTHRWMSAAEWARLDMSSLAGGEDEPRPEGSEYERVFEEFIQLAASTAS